MKHQQRWVTIAILLAAGPLGGCQKRELSAPQASETDRASAGANAPSSAASSSGPRPNETNRKIIRQAELEPEVVAPGTTQTAIEPLAEQHGGYVVSAARNTENGSAVDVNVTVTVRVPQAELMGAGLERAALGAAEEGGAPRRAR